MLFNSLVVQVVVAGLLNFALGERTYKSRPDLSPPLLNITTRATSEIQGGYLFVAPYGLSADSSAGVAQPGPYIFTVDGELVWSGFGYIAPWGANFQVARWNDQDVLFANEGILNPYRGHGHGHHKLLNQQYQTIAEVRSAGHYISDGHEFEIVGDCNALVGSYTPRRIDLSRWGGNGRQNWIIEYIFHEIDLNSGKVLFEWHSLEHVSPDEAVLPLGSQAGSGHNSATAWDYVHFNSITKGSDGHYLLSARHASALYKVNGTDGTIIWRLGGKYSDFALGSGVKFEFQHHARYVNRSLDTISLFDNSAGSGSAGKIVSLDLKTFEATFIQAFHPPHHIFAFSQGSTQILPDGGALVNWGSAGQVTQFDREGKVLFHTFLESNGRQEVTQNYRAFRGDWTGYSPETLAVVIEESEKGISKVWVSWNGDTRTVQWRISWGKLSEGINSFRSAEIPKSGFESVFNIQASSVGTDVVVQAIDEAGKVLKTSEILRTDSTLSSIEYSDRLTHLRDMLGFDKEAQPHQKVLGT